MICLVAEDRDSVKIRNTQIIEGERSESRPIAVAVHHTRRTAPFCQHAGSVLIHRYPHQPV
jgi:hypothetical protein